MLNYYNNRHDKPVVKKEHHVKLTNRKQLEITGVKEIDSFDNEEFLLETVMGYLVVRGHNLQLLNLDVEEGIVQIKGKIYDLAYLDDHNQGKAKGFLSKLFK